MRIQEFTKKNAKTIVASFVTGVTTFLLASANSFGERAAESLVRFAKKPIINEVVCKRNSKRIKDHDLIIADFDSSLKAHMLSNKLESRENNLKLDITNRKLDIIIANTVGLKQALELVNLTMAKGNDSTAYDRCFSGLE